jgi:hypothetical protein
MTNRLEQVDRLLSKVRDQKEREKILQAALLFCENEQERNKLHLWQTFTPKKFQKEETRGNPEWKKEFTIESEIEKGTIFAKAFDLLREDYQQYKPQKEGTVVSNNLKTEVAIQLNISESKVYRILENHFSALLWHFYQEQEKN